MRMFVEDFLTDLYQYYHEWSFAGFNLFSSKKGKFSKCRKSSVRPLIYLLQLANIVLYLVSIKWNKDTHDIDCDVSAPDVIYISMINFIIICSLVY
jgi:hypothetical protein